MVYKESGDCVGCPQGCIHCGRDKPYWVYECDICGETFYEEDEVTRIDGKDYCNRCYEKEFEEEDEDVSA